MPIQWLPPNQFRILKRLIIAGDRRNGPTELVSIVYTRTMQEGYKMIKQQIQNAKEKDKDPLSRLMKEYPAQNNYPEDEIDQPILGSNQQYFPASLVIS